TALLELIDGASPGDERWPGCVQALDTHAEAIMLIREAAGKRSTGMILQPGLSDAYRAATRRTDEVSKSTGSEPVWVIDVLLPQLGEFRMMARLLRIDALHAGEIGDSARIVADIEAMAGLGRHTREHPIVICDLVSHAIGTLTSKTVREIVRRSPGTLDDGSLARIDLAISSDLTGPETAMDLTGERYFILDLIQRLYTDDGHGDGHITAAGLSAIANRQMFGNQVEIPTRRVVVGFMSLYSMGRAELTAEVNEMYDEIEAYAATPMWERGSSGAELKIAQKYAEQNRLDLGRMLISLLMPALSKAAFTADRARTEAETTRMLIALQRHRLANGRWPGSLDEIVPSLLEPAPPDPFTGEPLRYRPNETGPVIYSVGVDREDDGGRHSEKASTWRPADQVQHALDQDPEGFGGDWVLEPEPIEDDE
ncbi:MAG: hypothetical protein K8E66_00495, partial [Phycisphaerales bacterium]|nr:hypothetical protein [Phycisphaerales bacterium]